MFTLNVVVTEKVHVEMTCSEPESRKIHSENRLTKKAAWTAGFTCVVAQDGFRGEENKVVITGKAKRIIIMIILVVITDAGIIIATTWICTKSFWFLRPTDVLLSFRSGSSGPRSSTKETEISSPRCYQPLSVGKGALTLIFRITI